MNPTLRNVLAVFAGLVAGMAANMATIMIFSFIIPPPEGVDINDVNSIAQAMEAGNYELKHYISPFIAHSLQALLGAFVTVKLAVSRHFMLAMIIAVLALAGGIGAVYMFPAPLWYNTIDLLFCYIPMGWLGYSMAKKRS